MDLMIFEEKERREEFIDDQLAFLEGEKKSLLKRLSMADSSSYDAIFEIYVLLSYKLEELKEKRLNNAFDMGFSMPNRMITSDYIKKGA